MTEIIDKNFAIFTTIKSGNCPRVWMGLFSSQFIFLSLMIFAGSRYGLFLGSSYKFYGFYYHFTDREITWLSCYAIFIAAMARVI